MNIPCAVGSGNAYSQFISQIMPSAVERTGSQAATKKDQKLVFKTDYRLIQVKSIAECSKGSTLQSVMI